MAREDVMNYGTPFATRPVGLAVPEVRAAFVRRVYSLFFASLLVTVGVGWWAYQPSTMQWLAPMMLPLFLVELVLIFGMGFARKVPGLNLAMFTLFAAINGLVMGAVMWYVEARSPGVGTLAGALTIATFGGLTAYAMVSGKNFSYLGGALTMGLLGLIVAGLIMMFFPSPMFSMLYALGGIALFSGFVLYDTHQIMTRLQPGDEVVGAMELYLDFINLFWLILRLLNELNRR
jgi:FtsH-binding integral membrane protein